MALSFRHREILSLAQELGQVTVEDLAERFGVSQPTIRRDLAELCDSGNLTRVRGGAMVSSKRANIGYSTRRRLAEAEKAAIGLLCARAIPNDCSLFINIGTTTEAVARALLRHRGLMVITNNLNVANILAENEDCDVIVAGGALRRLDGGLVGEATADFIRQFKVDYAIIGVSAIDEDGALLDYDYREVRVAQAIIQNARSTFLVTDATKFARTAPVRIGQLGDVRGLFTDDEPPAPIRELCESYGVRLEVTASNLPITG